MPSVDEVMAYAAGHASDPVSDPSNARWRLRCICGDRRVTTDYNAQAKCDDCYTSRHRLCMGLLPNEARYDWETATSGWYCELCHPQDHWATLAALAKNERIWLHRREYNNDVQSREHIISIVCCDESIEHWTGPTAAAYPSILGVTRAGVKGGMEILLNALSRVELRKFEEDLMEADGAQNWPEISEAVLGLVVEVCGSGRLDPMGRGSRKGVGEVVGECLRRYFVLGQEGGADEL